MFKIKSKKIKSISKKSSILIIAAGSLFMTACSESSSSSQPYYFTNVYTLNDLQTTMNSNFKSQANDSGFLLYVGTSACPVCHGMKDLNNYDFSYFWSHSGNWSTDYQQKWLDTHYKGNGPLNEYAKTHNVYSLYITGYKLEDQNGFNFENNPLWNWVYLLITNQMQMNTAANGAVTFSDFKVPTGQSAPNQGYAGWLNNNSNAKNNAGNSNNSWNHYWWNDSKDAAANKKANIVYGWNNGYNSTDTSGNSWYSHWPLLVWVDKNSQQQWQVKGWTDGYFKTDQLSSLESQIKANSQKPNANVSALSQDISSNLANSIYFTNNRNI